MEKVLAFNLGESQIKSLYRICSQMKIMVIEVPESQMSKTLNYMVGLKPYKGEGTAAEEILKSAAGRSMIVMCGLSDKHIDKILAALRITGLDIDYKAVLTNVNKEWNGVRMFAQMEAEKRAHEGV
ncbi:MAG: DUF3783 domain-containing protein [Eubacteriales bacterium]|nr:DUF3783 domain-containing protein [Eubacteriales bacterium]